MLRQLRSNTGRMIFGAAALFVIPSFVVFYGWNSPNKSTGSQVTTWASFDYNGKTHHIPSNLIVEGQNYLISRLALTASLQGQQLDRQTLDNLVRNQESFLGAIDWTIVQSKSEDMGVRVSPSHIVKEIAKQIPDPGQRLSQVDQIERKTGMRFDDWAVESSRQQTFALTQEALKAASRVTVNEAWIDHMTREERLVVDKVSFEASQFRNQVPTPTTETLQAYLASNGELFRIPPQATYRYISISKDELRGRMNVTDEETSSAYAARQGEFIAPRAVRASMIMVTPDDNLGTTASAEANRLAAEVLDRAKKGEDFSALHAQFSKPYPLPLREPEESTATLPGGSLGLVSETVARTEFGDEWTSAVFNATPGSVVGPLSAASGGRYLVKVEGFREQAIRPLAEVETSLRAQLAAQKAELEFNRRGQALQDAMSSVTSLDQLAAATGTSVTESGRVNRDAAFLPRIGMLGELGEVIRDLQKGSALEVLSDTRRHVVIQMLDEYPSRIPNLEEARGALTNAWTETEALSLAHNAAKSLEAGVKSGSDLARLATDKGTTVTRSEPFTRSQANDTLGITLENFDKVSVATTIGSILVLNYKNNPAGAADGVALLRIHSVEEPSRKDFLNQLPKIVDGLRNRRQLAYLNDFLAAKRKTISPTVKIETDLLRNNN
jgi:peptidyl-prolyl cis-trans isomerase D